MEGDFRKDKIKDWSERKQREYFGGFVKETIQQANFRKRITATDSQNKRKSCIENASKKMRSEGILGAVPGFFKDVVGIKTKK